MPPTINTESWLERIYNRLHALIDPAGHLNVRVADPLSGQGNVRVAVVESQAVDPDAVLGTVKLYDEATGGSRGLTFRAGQPVVTNQDYLYAIAEGDIPGHTFFRKLAASNLIGATEGTVWAPGNAYVFPSITGQQMEVVSSNINDTALGTGIRTVQITYLDTAFVEHTETIALSGTVAVPTVATNITRINRFRAMTAGTGGVAAGNIDVRHLADTPIYSRIATGTTRARTGVYTVPAGKTLFITSILCSGGTGTGARYVIFTLRTTWDETNDMPTAGGLFLPSAEVGVEDGGLLRTFEVPIKLGPQTDLNLVALSDGASTLCRCSLRGWIE